MSTSTYTSFGGTDIVATFNNKVFGELQMVSYKIQREKAPVYTMGSVDPRSIARGKRMISGVCVFIIFDRDSLLASMTEDSDKVYIGLDEIATYNSDVTAADAKAAISSGGSLRTISGNTVTSAASLKRKVAPVLGDQVLPFDITLYGVSEYGRAISMSITGVELMTEAGGVSIDDISLEKQIGFIARRVSPWKDVSSELQ